MKKVTLSLVAGFCLTSMISYGQVTVNGSNTQGYNINSNSGHSNGSSIHLNADGNSWSGGAEQGTVSIIAGDGSTNTASFTPAFKIMKYDAGNYPTLFSVLKDGRVLMGDGVWTPNSNYTLFVSKGILTEKVKIALKNDPTNWSDFVFSETYKLMPLAEVEEYIKENKHLPEIPSTEEVHKEGLDIAQMDAKLLQKIEELTLYVIQQQKEIEKLKAAKKEN